MPSHSGWISTCDRSNSSRRGHNATRRGTGSGMRTSGGSTPAPCPARSVRRTRWRTPPRDGTSSRSSTAADTKRSGMQERTTARSRTESKAAPPPRPSRRRAVNWPGLLLVAPAVLLVAAFTLYPFAQALYTSTQLSSPLIEAKFVGLQNYRDVITSSYFLDATRTTALFTVVAVPVLVVLGVFVAVLLNEPFFGNGFLRAGMLLPWAIPASAAGVIWQWVFLDDSGALNVSLYSL